MLQKVTGTLDHLAGSTDESVSRSFDKKQGGGVWSGFSGTFDHLGGSTDEAAGRTFDTSQGGGYGDPRTYASGADDMAGSFDETFGSGSKELGKIVGNTLGGKMKLIKYGGIVAVVGLFLYLIRPILAIVESQT